MLVNILRQFNWLDIFVVIFLMRVFYIAGKNGLLIELFKFMGTLAAVYLSLHYYTDLSDKFLSLLHPLKERMPLEFSDFICFIVLAAAGYTLFALLHNIFFRFVKVEATASLNRIGGLVLGAFRAYLLIGLIMFAMAISTVAYLQTSVKESFTATYFLRAAPDTYGWLWDRLASKFMGSERFNKTVNEVQEGFAK